MLIGLVPAAGAVIGLNLIVGAEWPVALKVVVAAAWLWAVLLVSYWAAYRWGDDRQRRDIANATRVVRGVLARLTGR